MTMRRGLVVFLVLALGACGSKKAEPGSGPGGAPAKPTTGTLGGGTRDATKSLWQLAPDEAIMGVVIAPGAGKTAAERFTAIATELRARGLGQLVDGFLKEIEAKELGFAIDDVAAWRTKGGIDLARPAALFMSVKPEGGGRERPYVLVPVVDRVAFRALTKMEQKTVGGLDVDQGSNDKPTCTQHGDQYLCADDVAGLERMIKPHTSPLAELAAGLPAEGHGDATLIVDLARIPEAQRELADMARMFGTMTSAGGALRLVDDGLWAHGWAAGSFGGPVALATRARTTPVTLSGQTGGAGMILRVLMDPAPLLATAPARMPLPGTSIDMREGYLDQLTGEVQIAGGGQEQLAGQILVGIKDASKVGTTVRDLCGLAKLGLAQQKPSPITIEAAENRCSGTVDLAAVATQTGLDAAQSKGLPTLPFDLRTTPGLLSLTVGTAIDRKGDARTLAGHADTQAMLGDAPTTVVFWQRTFDPELDRLPPFLTETLTRALDGQMLRQWIDLVQEWIYEVGVHGAVTATRWTFTARITTFSGDAPAARAAYATARKLPWAQRQAAMTKVAADFPGTRTAQRAKVEAQGGSGFYTSPLGFMAFGAVMAVRSRGDVPPVEPLGDFEPARQP
jgi:hypothetical protein